MGAGENLLVKPTALVRRLAEDYVRPGMALVDATAGNGHDTVALAKLLFGTEGRQRENEKAVLYAFDVQEEALAQTEWRLRGEGGFETELDCGAIRLILDSHARMKDYIKEEICLALFNLGYLPGGDKELTTRKDSTLVAVEQALKLLCTGGAVFLTLYGGHWAGAEEKEAVLSFVKELPPKQYHVIYVQMWNQPAGAPETVAIAKK